jgi:hypothetical protein
MVFWKNISWTYLVQALFARQPFTPLVFDRTPQRPPSEWSIQRLRHPLEEAEAEDLTRFLYTYFGNPPHKPRLSMKKEQCIPETDLGILIRDSKKEIIGCIRYHLIGRFMTDASTPEIYSVDCFCIHPRWRKKGMGDFLLQELHLYANEVGKYYATFLKEGPSISFFHRPIYTSEYAYRYTPADGSSSPFVHRLTTAQVQKAIQMYQKMYPSTWIVWNPASTEQVWYLYQRNSCYVWACIQPAHQEMITSQGTLTMGWMTAWLESGELADSFRAEACLAMTHRAHHGYDAIWVDHTWTGKGEEWRKDGAFHFYTYQWATNQSMGISYCMAQ